MSALDDVRDVLPAPRLVLGAGLGMLAATALAASERLVRVPAEARWHVTIFIDRGAP